MERTHDPSKEARQSREAYERVLLAMVELKSAAAVLPRNHPAHQELDQARLAVSVTLDVLAP